MTLALSMVVKAALEPVRPIGVRRAAHQSRVSYVRPLRLHGASQESVHANWRCGDGGDGGGAA